MILRPGEARVGLRPADLEPAGRVHEDPHARSASSSGNSRSTGSITSALDVGREQRLDVDLLAVLRADQHGVDAHRAGRPRTRSRPGSCRRAAGTERRPPCGRRRGACDSRWAIAIGSGISSSVSRHAKPNIMPWSPAPRWSSGVARVLVAVLERVVDARGRCRATAPGSPSSRRRSRRRGRTWRPCSRRR